MYCSRTIILLKKIEKHALIKYYVKYKMKIAYNFHKETENHGKPTIAMKTRGKKIGNMFKHYKTKKKTTTKTPKKKKKYLVQTVVTPE